MTTLSAPRPQPRRAVAEVADVIQEMAAQTATPARHGVQPDTVTAVAPAGGEPTTLERPERREVHALNHEWEWQLAGACREADPELFFHPWGERDPSRTRREVAAKAVCARCPVLRQCRAYALETREPYGVWGGLSEHDREDILGVRFG